MEKPMDTLTHIGDKIEELAETLKRQYEECYGEPMEDSDE